MIVKYRDREYEVELVEDGDDRTVIKIDGNELAVPKEIADMCRHPEAGMDSESLKGLVWSAIDAGATEELYETEPTDQEGWIRGSSTEDGSRSEDSETVGKWRTPAQQRTDLRPAAEVRGNISGGPQDQVHGPKIGKTGGSQ